MSQAEGKENMKSLSKINNVVSNGKVGAGGALVTLILTVTVIILETRKQNIPSLQKGDEIFLSCSESGNIYHNNEKTQSFLSCYVTNLNHRKTWSYPNIGSSVSEDIKDKINLPDISHEKRDHFLTDLPTNNVSNSLFIKTTIPTSS